MPMNAVVANSVVLGYGSEVAVASSTFTIPAGTVTAIIGPNGSGKSTMLNAIAGLVEPQAGSLEVPASKLPGHRVSYVLQTTKVNDALPITVGEVVAMARYSGLGFYRPLDDTDKEAVAAAIDRVGLGSMISKHLHELSGGQRQRVFVAQGLAQEHDILMLDEPLTGIDLPTAQAIDEVIHNERSRGCTVIMTTHDLSEAQFADHVVMMSGRVVASGPPAEVLTGENLSIAYGPSLLHVNGGTVFIDDPAHVEVPGRHVHQQRVIHTDPMPSDVHHDER